MVQDTSIVIGSTLTCSSCDLPLSDVGKRRTVLRIKKYNKNVTIHLLIVIVANDIKASLLCLVRLKSRINRRYISLVLFITRWLKEPCILKENFDTMVYLISI
jgi:hypothetical protein